MAIVKWDPLATLPSFQDRINSIFEEAFPGAGNECEPAMCDWRPLVDTFEEGDTIVINAELPGVRKEDVSIDVKDNIITISGHRTLETNSCERKYFRRERCHGSFHRAFKLPETADPEKIEASFKNGLLKIVIRHADEASPKKVEIK